MSDPSLHQLERDVEAARAKLAGDLSTLRSPATYSEFSSELKYEALDMKDALVDKAKSSVQSTIDNLRRRLESKSGGQSCRGIGHWRGNRVAAHPTSPDCDRADRGWLVQFVPNNSDPWERADYGRISRPGKKSTCRAGERPRGDREGQRIRDRRGRSGEGNRARDWSERACTGNGRSRNQKGNGTRCRC